MRKRGLVAIIKQNFDIRGRNEKHRQKDGEYVADPQNNRPGSPQDSEYSVKGTDWDLIKPSKMLFNKVIDWLFPERLAEMEKVHTSTSTASNDANPIS